MNSRATVVVGWTRDSAGTNRPEMRDLRLSLARLGAPFDPPGREAQSPVTLRMYLPASAVSVGLRSSRIPASVSKMR